MAQRVVGADLPDDEVGLGLLHLALHAVGGALRHLAGQAAAHHVEVHALEGAFERGLELGDVGGDGEEAPTPTVEDEPMASTLTSRLARAARLSARSGRRKRSPAMRLVLQSGDSTGGAAGSTNAGARSKSQLLRRGGEWRKNHEARESPRKHPHGH